MVFVSLAGCATTNSIPPAQMVVEAIRNDASAARNHFSYVIEDGQPVGSDESTYYDLAVKYVRTALSSKGLFEAPEGTKPDMIVEIDFGMEAPLVLVGDSYNMGWTGDDATALAVDRIIYDKYLRITARETPEQAKDRPPRELWSIYVTNTDEQSNLPRYILLMVSAAMDEIGEHTSARRAVVLTLKDGRVAFVKKGM